MTFTIPLKIKLIDLAQEAKTIRRFERKLLTSARKRRARQDEAAERFQSEYKILNDHRKDIVRPEARATQLAYGYIRGKRYRQIEQFSYEPPNWSKVEKMIKKYGDFDRNAFDIWRDEPERRPSPQPIKEATADNG